MLDWKDLAALTNQLVLPLLGYGAWVLRDIRDQLKTLNGRLLVMETWRSDHQKEDDAHHARMETSLTRINDRLMEHRP